MSVAARRESLPSETEPTTLLELRFAHPRYWGTWFSVLFLWLLDHVPAAVQYRAGQLLGWLMFALMRRRRHIARTNLALCFPELDDAAREALLREHFLALGVGIAESGTAWSGRDDKLASMARVRGFEHLEAGLRAGKGVILLSAHFTGLELGLRLLNRLQICDAVYRPHNNALYNRLEHRHRVRHLGMAIRRDDVRALFARLKGNNVVWYAPDQNYDPRQSEFVPFMGVPAATITTTARIARISGAAVVPYFPHRLPGTEGYELVLLPALEDFPTGDARADAARINRIIEDQVRRSPAQYLWVHRRFKSRPPGEPGVY